jgi:hypothetical protein
MSFKLSSKYASLLTIIMRILEAYFDVIIKGGKQKVRRDGLYNLPGEKLESLVLLQRQSAASRIS